MTMKKLIKTIGVALAFSAFASFGAQASEGGALKQVDWSFNGTFGQFDKAQLRRGFQVYREVCSACHSVRLIAFRNLADIGFSEDEIKAIAAEYEVQDGPNDDGDMFMRPGRPSDRIPGPFANEKQARAANNGAYPPDLSLMAKARFGGPDYIHSLLTGYEDAPEGFELGEGMNYNPVFAGAQIAMVAPISDDMLEYADGTPATADQISRDVSAFLMWTAEPSLEARKSLGFRVMLFLAIFTVLFYFINRKVWKPVKRGEQV